MNISKRLVVLGLGGLILGVSGGGVLAQGQVHEARGTVIAVTDTAHGHFDRFTREQAQSMVVGVRDFVARHV